MSLNVPLIVDTTLMAHAETTDTPGLVGASDPPTVVVCQDLEVVLSVNAPELSDDVLTDDPTRVPCTPALQLLRVLSDTFPAQRTPEWLTIRRQYITGSEVAKVKPGPRGGQSQRKALLFAKLGVDPHPFQGNEHTQHGTKYEPEAADAYAERTGAHVHGLNMIPHHTLSHVAFSPDGWAVLPSGEERLIEIKCPSKRALSPEVPSYYVPQVQLGLHVLYSHGLDVKCDFIQYVPAGHNGSSTAQLLITTVERDPQWWTTWSPLMQQFWCEVEHWASQPQGIRSHPECAHYEAYGAFPPAPLFVSDQSGRQWKPRVAASLSSSGAPPAESVHDDGDGDELVSCTPLFV